MVKTCCRPVLRSFAARGSESFLSFSQRGPEDNNKRALQKKGSLSAHLSMRFLVSALGLREAVAAVNRAAVARLEGHLSLAAACGTDSGEHLAGTAGGAAAAATAGLFPGLTAGRAALGLVGEALGSEELLLGGAEGEISAAVCALDDFVLGHGMTLAPFFIILWFTVGHPDRGTNLGWDTNFQPHKSMPLPRRCCQLFSGLAEPWIEKVYQARRNEHS